MFPIVEPAAETSNRMLASMLTPCSTLCSDSTTALLIASEIELDIEQTDKIQRIKERVEEKEGIPPAQQRLIFGGKQMYVDPDHCY